MIRKITSVGVVTTLAGTAGNVGFADGLGAAASFAGPRGVAVDSADNVYVADSDNSIIRKITPAGAVTTMAGLANTTGSIDGTGFAARFYNPYNLSVDTEGSVLVADLSNMRVRKITASGVVSTVAGRSAVGSADGVGTDATFYNPISATVDASGNIYVSDLDNLTIRRIPAGY